MHVELEAGEERDVEITFGGGYSVAGRVENATPGKMLLVQLRAKGGLGPEEYDPFDMAEASKAARYVRGVGMVRPDGTFTLRDVAPGEYILEVPPMPDNIMDMQAYSEMDRTPLYRATITVEEENRDLALPLAGR